MIAAGYVHKTGADAGRPNKRAFARALCLAANQDGADGSRDLIAWERKVYRWTSAENPGGMSDENAELAARVLGLQPDELKIDSVVQELQRTREESDDALRQLSARVGELAQQVAELRHLLTDTSRSQRER